MLTFSGVAYAADMPVKAPPPAPIAPVTNWTGFYIGAQVGGAGLDPSCSTEAVSYPFIYSADDRIDLGRRHHPDPTDRLGSWARGFIRSAPTDTSALLADLNSGVAASISYQSRETEGTQSPIETLSRGWGSCP
jgi:hypothetical protein